MFIRQHARKLVVGGAGVVLAVIATSSSPSPARAIVSGVAPVDFNAEVRPILSRRCFLCHGPDSSTRKAGLRLDLRDEALAATRGGGAPAIVPGDADASRLIRKIESDDDDIRMPPDDRPRLAPEEIDVLRRWIDAGAEYKGHWAWAPIRDDVPPAVDDPDWAAHPVDRFVYDRLRDRGLAPACEADRPTLIRRLAFDLTGLPPTVAEVDAFIADDSKDAWENVVDRLLDSPRYGERWARHWLDLVRYAETHGHEFDYPIRHAWQYRDYVIRALNADVPYDEFVTEHLAGDLLAAPRTHPTESYDESIIGTGFWFLSQGTHGPVDVRADEAERIANQIDVLSKAFLGVTVGCARCHDHKFDPVSTQDFYALAGFLQSSRRQEAYLDPNHAIKKSVDEMRRVVDAADEIALGLTPNAADLEQVAAYARVAGEAIRMIGPGPGDGEREPKKPNDVDVPDESSIAAARNLAAAASDLDRKHLSRWITALREPPPDHHPARSLFVALTGPVDEPEQVDASSSRVFESFDTLERWYATGHAFGPGATGPLRLAARPAPPSSPPGFTPDGFTPPVFTPSGVVDSGRLGAHLQGTLRSATFEIDSDSILYKASGRGGRIRVIIDGYVLDEFNALLFEGFKIDVNTGIDGWIEFRQNVSRYRGHRVDIEIIDDGDGFIAVDEIRFDDGKTGPRDPRAAYALDPGRTAAEQLYDACAGAVAALAAGSCGPEQTALLNWMFARSLLVLGDPAEPPVARLTELLQEAAAIDESVPEPMRVLAIADGTAEDEYVFVRGSPRNLGAVAPRRFIESLGSADQPAITDGSGRLELARRLLAPENPLPPRVMANRVWLHLFGEGIVPTPDDFGGLGLPPSDPALLDWLAAWFRGEGEWSIKKLVRLLVTSRTYRMESSTADPRARERDPDNRLLHRANVRRLEAEAIRDAILSVSGRLDATMYGRSVPVALTAFMTGRGRPKEPGPQDGNGRRTIYLEVRRNFRPALMTVFDAPVPASTVGRRTRSNVPAQALMLMNDPFVAKQAKLWATRVLGLDGLDAAGRIELMFREAFGRFVTPQELDSSLAFLRLQTAEQNAEDWRRFEPAWSDLAHALLNMKEFVFLP